MILYRICNVLVLLKAGFMPATAFAMVAATGDIYFGLWYPTIVAGAAAVIGFFFLPESRFTKLSEEVASEPAHAET